MAGLNGMERFGVQEARQRFPELLVRASKGERLVIQRHRQDLAAIVPLQDSLLSESPNNQQAMENLVALKGSLRGLKDDREILSRGVHQKPRFDPRELTQGSRISLDGSALLAFFKDEASSHQIVEPILQGIAQGTWIGVLSTVSLIDVLHDAICCVDESLGQRYEAAFSNQRHWVQVEPDTQLVVAASRLRKQEPALGNLEALEIATAIEFQSKVFLTGSDKISQTKLIPTLKAVMSN